MHGISFAILVLLGASGSSISSQAYKFDQDTTADCESHLQECTSDDRLYFSCPVACSAYLKRKGDIGEAKDRDAFYEHEVTAWDGTSVSLMDFEGSVVIFALVPLLPGMAQYYYELLEDLQSRHRFNAVTFFQPYIVDKYHQEKYLKVADKPNVKMLLPTYNLTSVVEYLFGVTPIKNPLYYTGEDDEVEDTRYNDRVTIFVVSTSGKFVDRLVTPHLSTLEKRIRVYMKMIEKDL